MLEYQFVMQNLHFAVSLFAALAFFAVAWLYFDAWYERKTRREIPKFIGFLFLSLSFITYAPLVEQTILSNPLLGEGTINLTTGILRILGYSLVTIGLYLEPIQPRPVQTPQGLTGFPAIGILGKVTGFFAFIFPLLSFTIAGLYLRRATTGLERHVKRVAFGFITLGIAESFHISSVFRNSNQIITNEMVSSYGFFWLLEHLFLVIATIIFWNWVFRYLLKRLQSQLFIVFTSLGLLIFLSVTLIFSFLLFASLITDAQNNLKTSTQVLSFAIDSKKSEALSDAQMIAQNPHIISNIKSRNKQALENLTNEIISSKNQSYLLVVLPSGEVIARPDSSEKVGESVSGDTVFQKAQKGIAYSTVASEKGVLSPQVIVKAAVPIIDEEKIIGVIITGTVIDNAFVDGIKSATGLDSSIYAGLEMSATTLIAPDGKSRYIGAPIEEGNLISEIFVKGQTFISEIDILTTPYLVAVSPLKDIDNNSIGMLLIGREKSDVLQTVSRAAEATFLLSVLLFILSVLPIYLTARYISNQFSR